jgi:hypothetical protein
MRANLRQCHHPAIGHGQDRGMRLVLAQILTVLIGLVLIFALLPWLDDEPEGWRSAPTSATTVPPARLSDARD